MCEKLEIVRCDGSHRIEEWAEPLDTTTVLKTLPYTVKLNLNQTV